MTRTSSIRHHSTSTQTTHTPARSWPTLLLVWFCTVLPGFGQTFLAEWTALPSGGVAPVGLALATEAGVTYLYACDQPRGRILKFNTTTGAVAAVIGSPGAGNGQFDQPYGIAVHAASGDLYVAERGNNRIQRVTNSGVFVMSWGGPGTAQGQFTDPVGVAVDATGDVYVTENGAHRVQKFRVTQTGGTWGATHLAMWGTQGSGNGQFNQPFGIAADAAGNIWVADGFNGRVQRFNTAGVFQSTVGSAGTAPGQFVVATGVGVDSAGNLFVSSTNSNPQNGALADANNQWISRFSAAGAFVSRWGGTHGTANGQFRLPFAVVVGPSNRAYVSDFYNNRVQVFDLTAGGGPDTTPPTVASFTTGATTATSVTFNLTFSEPVTGVDSSDFTVVTTGGATAGIGAVAGSGASYTIPVTFGGAGTVQLNLNATGTGIADLAANAIAAGATGPVYTIPAAGGVSGIHAIAVTPPPNGTYGKGEVLTFTVRFSGIVSVVDSPGGGSGKNNDKGKGKDDDDDDDGSVYFNWSAAGFPPPRDNSQKMTYRSGSGTDTLTFRYKVKNGDVAPDGILLATMFRMEDGTSLRDAGGATLTGQQLTIPWPQNPLTGVVLDAGKSNSGNGNSGNPGIGGNPGNSGNAKGKNRLVNLSSRLRVTGGDASRSVVAGFVVTGTAPKPVLIRAVGPGLAGFGVRDALAQPRLQLRDSTGQIVAENDGWNNRLEISLAGDRLGAFKLTPNSRDAALLVALTPGAYTAQVTANGNGLVLLEVYDGSTGTEIPTEQIVNISTRGFVGTGDDVLVAGFVVTGDSPRRVLIRGIGPALSGFGVPGALADPVLRLHRAGATSPIAQNDDWQTPLPVTGGQAPATAAEITTAATAAGAFPLAAGSKDAAIVVSLAPGQYSVIVSGANNGTGGGLVEVYELP